MATLRQIRVGLKAALDAIGGMQVKEYLISNPTPPAVEMFPADVNYDRSMRRGHDEVTMIVRGFVAFSTDIGSQQLLDEWIAPSGAKSFKAAIEADDTLGGIVDDLRVTQTSNYGLYRREGQAPVLAAEWTVEILNPGT